MVDQRLAVMIRELGVSILTELANHDKEILAKNIADLLGKEPEEIISSFAILFDKLSREKIAIRKGEKAKEFFEVQGYQQEMQRLDSKIRDHFKNELEMKVYIDNLEEKMASFEEESLSHSENNIKVIEKFSQMNADLKEKIKQKKIEIEELSKIKASEQEKENAESRVKKEIESIKEAQETNEAIYKNYSKAKKQLEVVNKEYEKLRIEFLELKNLTDKKDRSSSKTVRQDLNKESFEIKSSRTPRRVEKSLSPIQKPRKKTKTPSKINKTSSRIEKSCRFSEIQKKKHKKIKLKK